MCIYIHTHACIHIHTRMHLCLQREREGEREKAPTQVCCLAGGLCQPFPAQIFPGIPRGGAVGGGALQHEVLAPGCADDARRQEHVNDRLQ